MKFLPCLAVAIIGLSSAQMLLAQIEPPHVPLRADVLAQLPAPYREAAEEHKVTASESDQKKWLQDQTVRQDEVLGNVISRINTTPEGLGFLLNRLHEESSSERRLLILTKGIRQRVRGNPSDTLRTQLGTALHDIALNDSDVAVSQEALENLRMLQASSFGRLVAARAEKASAAGDSAGASELLATNDAFIPWDEQVNLPNFLRTPPPVFNVVPEDKPIRALAFGDFGNASPAQMDLAKVMLAEQQKRPFDFGLTFGDNFYGIGVSGLDDPQWKNKWEDVYGPLHLKFYASLGNHDYGQADSPAAEVLYSGKSDTWRMPATFYTFTAGSVQFFAIDTVEMENAQFAGQQTEWLKTELSKSKARWKVVYGHYQVYSSTRGDQAAMIRYLLPVLKDRADIYICGHDHNMQELKDNTNVRFFVSGGGGASLYDFRHPIYSHNVFRVKANGFSVLEADQTKLTLTFIGIDGKELHRAVFTK